MEHISEILKQTRINTSRANTDTWSGAEEEETSVSAGCSLCQGAGVVHPRLATGNPDYSRVVACSCSRAELGKERQNRLQKYSNLGALSYLSFENLAVTGRSGDPRSQQSFRQASEAARKFAAEPRGWLVLSGPSGSGKTHLAAAIVNERVSQGYPASYVTVPDLLDHLRAAFNPDSEMPYDEFFEQVRNAPLLVLDDLGVQAGTTWAREKLDQLLNHRFRGQLPTVIIPIIPLDELEERIRVRLTDAELSQLFVLEEKQTRSPDKAWSAEFQLQKGMTFDSFDRRRVNLPAEQRENLEEAYRLAFEFAGSPEGWLVFMGETGCGKTHLAAAIVNYLYQAGKPAFFVVVVEFLDHLRSAFNPESKESYDQIFERVKTAPLLVLDDFGEHATTPWALEKLYQVINYRYNARLATVITTRYSVQEIMEGVESSISSRMVDPQISIPFNIMAPDYRGDQRPSQRRIPRGGRKNR
ncbi:MAG: ATP-binding protein [Dehalococcoidales bacterium]